MARLTNSHEAVLEAVDTCLASYGQSQRTSGRRGPRDATDPLDPRFCEEHSAVALATLLSALSEDRFLSTVAEKLGNLLLARSADQTALEALKRQLMEETLRRDRAAEVVESEKKAGEEYRACTEAWEKYASLLNPADAYAKDQIANAGQYTWVSTIWQPNCTTEIENQLHAAADGWPRKPADPKKEDLKKKDSTKTAVNWMTEHARYAQAAAFNVAHKAALASQTAARCQDLAQEGRIKAAEHALSSARAGVEILKERIKGLEGFIKEREDLATIHRLLHFREQYDAVTVRLGELVADGKARLTAAWKGLSDVFGEPNTGLPTDDDVAALLQSAQECARVLARVQARGLRQRISMAVPTNGTLVIDMDWPRMALRDVRFTSSSGNDVAVGRAWLPDGSSVKFVSALTGENNAVRDAESGRAVHNRDPRGTWKVQYTEKGTLQIVLDVFVLAAE